MKTEKALNQDFASETSHYRQKPLSVCRLLCSWCLGPMLARACHSINCW